VKGYLEGKLLSKSCFQIIEELSSREPVPGGGSATAYVGALGMALGTMVGNLTLGKKKYKDVEQDIIALLEKSKELTEQLKELVNADAEAFYPLAQCYSMPQNTDEEKKQRDERIQKCLVKAAEVPLEIARSCRKAVDLLDEYARIGTKAAISDAGVGAAFCKAALQGAKLNVLINTKIMKDKELKNKIETELEEVVNSGMAKADSIIRYVEDQLKTPK